jgi:hypothetical protein
MTEQPTRDVSWYAEEAERLRQKASATKENRPLRHSYLALAREYDRPPLKFSNRGCQGGGVKAHLLDQHRLAGFRVLSAVCRWGRRTLASDGGSAEVVHALVTA